MIITLTGEAEFVETIVTDWAVVSQQLHERLGHKVTARDRIMVTDTAGEPFCNFEVGSEKEGKDNLLCLTVGAMYDSQGLDRGNVELSRLWGGVVQFLSNAHDLAEELQVLGDLVQNRHIEQLKEAMQKGLLSDQAKADVPDIFPGIWHGFMSSALMVQAWRSLGPDTQNHLVSYVDRGFMRDPATWEVLSKTSGVCGVDIGIHQAWRSIVLKVDPHDFFLPTTFNLEGVEAVNGCRQWLDAWEDQND